MSTGEWKIGRSAKYCHACGSPLAAGQDFFSAVREDNEDVFVRMDYCTDCWSRTDRQEFFSYWKARPVEENRRKRRRADDAIVLDFFWQLQDADSEQKQRFRFAVALYLVRRKLFRIREIRRTDDGEVLVLSYPRGQRTDIEVPTPDLTEAAIEEATRDLNRLLDVEMEA